MAEAPCGPHAAGLKVAAQLATRRVRYSVAERRPAGCWETPEAVAAVATAGLGCPPSVAVHVAEHLAALLAPQPYEAVGGVQEATKLWAAAAA